jgi:hypothetical protein
LGIYGVNETRSERGKPEKQVIISRQKNFAKQLFSNKKKADVLVNYQTSKADFIWRLILIYHNRYRCMIISAMANHGSILALVERRKIRYRLIKTVQITFYDVF